MTTQDRAPAFLFYAKDWLADPKVRALSWDQRGRYIDLLASMWEYSVYGDRIPRQTAERLYGKAFVKLVADSKEPVVLTEEWQGCTWLFSARLLDEAQKVKSRSVAATRAAAKRWGKDDDDADA